LTTTVPLSGRSRKKRSIFGRAQLARRLIFELFIREVFGAARYAFVHRNRQVRPVYFSIKPINNRRFGGASGKQTNRTRIDRLLFRNVYALEGFINTYVFAELFYKNRITEKRIDANVPNNGQRVSSHNVTGKWEIRRDFFVFQGDGIYGRIANPVKRFTSPNVINIIII